MPLLRKIAFAVPNYVKELKILVVLTKQTRWKRKRTNCVLRQTESIPRTNFTSGGIAKIGLVRAASRNTCTTTAAEIMTKRSVV